MTKRFESELTPHESIGMTECKHDGIATYRLLDGTPGMWGCTQCAHKFVPIDLAMEARAEKWREHEAASLKAEKAFGDSASDRLQQFGSM